MKIEKGAIIIPIIVGAFIYIMVGEYTLKTTIGMIILILVMININYLMDRYIKKKKEDT